MSTTDYPAPCRIVDKYGHRYRLQFRSHGTDATVGQLVAVTDDDTEAQPIELTRDGVHQTDVDTEVHCRFANAGLHVSTDES